MLTTEQQRERIARELVRLSGRKTLPVSASATPQEQPQRSIQKVEPIAIIGLSGCFPGCMSVGAFWQALDQDRCLIGRAPANRFAFWERDNGGLNVLERATRWGGYIPNIRGFDAGFFNILPSEADFMDPRERMLLMSVYHSLEDAGYAPSSLKKKPVGVFIGLEENEYFQNVAESRVESVIGNSLAANMAANRISYFLDLRGPSEVVNTMCSGAAVALHRAVCSLRSGESSMALVGAANLLLRPEPFLQLWETGQLSPDNSVRSFGKNANGFLRAEGVASVVLKPLSQAERDGDSIYAIIRNTAVNYNGQGGMSMAAPNIAAHADLIKICYREAGIDPGRVDYIEAQGMGNPVADIAEWQAFNRALGDLAEERGAVLTPGGCRVSTLKPMTGHMHSASALGALFKIIRSFQTDRIHKIPGFSELNPELIFEGQPCRPARETEAWAKASQLRLAGLHSYGASGNNAHILIEEYRDPVPSTDSENDPVIIPISAQTAPQRLALVRQLLETIEQHPEYRLSGIARTMQRGRDSMPYRVAFVPRDRSDWLKQARSYLCNEKSGGVFESVANGKQRLPESLTDAHRRAEAWSVGLSEMTWTEFPARCLHLPGYLFELKDYWYRNEAVQPSLPKPSPQPGGTGQGQAEAIVRELLSPYFKVAPGEVDLDASFIDAGFNSMLVTQIADHLEQKYSIQIEPARFFEYKTPRQFAQSVTKFIHEADVSSGSFEPEEPKSFKNSTLTLAQSSHSEPIAIIGVAGRYPESTTLDEFWENLAEGRDCISEIPKDRWSLSQYFDSNPETAARNGKSYGKWGGFIRGLHEFDPLFFKISPLEAETMSPKERLVLENVWHVLEDAGYAAKALAGRRVGVFFGVTRAGWDAYPGTFSSVANRVSYFFDFQGPSMPIDTMCSSSLVAIHEACQHIRSGECELAIAGGVNLYLDPSHYVVLAHGRFLSSDGKCRSFGADANGMVPGEGVGSVMLKRFSAAVRDGDQIYGVIRASVTNHGGNANGFTVPNPAAHRDLIVQALERGNVDPRKITYVEAHGTGTSLGDPVEVRGLSEAYRKFTNDTAYCRLGSLKSNMGHLEAAAGIAGLTKILLQMKYRKLAPSLHSSELNPNIDFSATPFVVQQSLESWNSIDATGCATPRIAAVSSFGAGGSNAHLVIEEFEESSPTSLNDDQPKMILLSARNQPRLLEAAQNLRVFIEKHRDCSLSDIAYTLQIGRDAMDERLGIMARSLDELKEKLQIFVEKQESASGIYRDRSKTRRDESFAEVSEDDWINLIDGWVRKSEFEKILKLWVGGANPNWNQLYSEQKPRRISLPLYPFAREIIGLPHLVPEFRGDTSESSLHPLVQRNTSQLTQQRFSSTFTGEEFFLADHLVQGQRMLPGAAYLEMARVAAERSLVKQFSVSDGHSSPAVRFRDVLWTRPFSVAEKGKEVHIRLSGDVVGPVEFEVYSDSEENGGESLKHGQGVVHFEIITPPAPVDIKAVQSRTGVAQFSAEQCYSMFRTLGIEYGPGHQGIETLHIGRDEVLARLRLPSSVAGTEEQFILHPSIIDAAFQASIGFNIHQTEHHNSANGSSHNENGKNGKNGFDPLAQIKPSLPYAVESVDLFQRCSFSMWAVIRRPVDYRTSGKVEKFDLDLCDDLGVVCVRIKGFSARVLEPAKSSSRKQGLLMQIPVWDSGEPKSGDQNPRCLFERRTVLFCSGKADPINLSGHSTQGTADFRHLELKGKNLAKEYQDAVLETFQAIRGILDSKPKGESLIQVVVPNEKAFALHSGLVGMLRTINLEFPKLHGQLIQIESGSSREKIAEILEENANSFEDTWIRYNEGQRQVASWAEFSSSNAAHPWKTNGIYLITGGLGGLGRIFADEILSQVKEATLILIGRSEITEDGTRFLDGLKERGAKAEYYQVDIRQREKVKDLIRKVSETYGSINGILHTAGVLRDQYLIRKSAKDIETVLGPKVTGTVNLDESTRDLNLDFFVLFSSMASLGNPGQGDYAAANGFLDAFARYRNALVPAKARHGGTLAINWPFWKEGGMRMDAGAERLMTENTGLSAMDTKTGLEAFYRCLASDQSQIMVLNGDLDRIRLGFLRELNPAKKTTVPAKSEAVSKTVTEAPILIVRGSDLKASVSGFLKKVICETLKINPEEMETDKDLYGYGLDSILVLDVNNQLEKNFPRLSKTLFFEYSTIEELSEYFVEAHRPALETMFGETKTAPPDHESPNRLEETERFSPNFSVAGSGGDGFDFSSLIPASGSAIELTKSVQPNGVSSNGHLHSVGIDDLIRHLGVEVFHSVETNLAGPSPREKWPGWSSFFQSFGMFEKAEKDFSFSKMMVNPKNAQIETALYLEGQIAIRRALFRGEELTKIKKIMDLGCGRASDLMEMAISYPHLYAEGLTIDPEEAKFASQVISQKRLADRVRIRCEDSTNYEFGRDYDLIFSIQVMHFIPEFERKKKLFWKIATALRQEGVLLMAEFVSHLKKPMRDPVLKTVVHTAREWAELLSESGFLIDAAMDVSEEIVNFLRDPDLEKHVAGMDHDKKIEIRKYNSQISGLENKWVNYYVMRAVKDAVSHSFEERMQINLDRLMNATRFKEMKFELTNGMPQIAYTNLFEHFWDCIETGVPIGSPGW